MFGEILTGRTARRTVIIMDITDQDINLVTGASGLLGSHVVEQLRRRGRRVRALVRPTTDTTWLRTQGVEFAEGDITDRASLKLACEGVKVVYHVAARVGDWGPWHEFQAITIDGTQNVIDAASEAGVERLLHISSISAYGHVNGKGLVLDESAPLGQCLNKWSYYSRAKVEAEKLVWAAHESGRLKVSVIRPSWLYGPRDRATLAGMISAIRRRKTKLIGDGTNRLNLVHAGNAAEAAIMAAESDKAIGEAYNASNDGVITQAGYFNAIAKAIGEPPIKKKVPYKVAKTAAFVLEFFYRLFGSKKPPLVTHYSVWLIGRHSFFETEKIKRDLGWTSSVSYEQGIPDTVAWYLREHENAAPDVGVSAAQA